MGSPHVTKRTNPELGWNPKPRVFWIVHELINSDAYRSLSKFESDLLFFILSLRQYPRESRNFKKSRRDYWSPTNGYELKIAFKAVQDFFNRDGMRKKPPVESTIARAISKLMAVGFLSIVRLGGSGPGVFSIYRLEHNWRVWKVGDGPCFTKKGMSRVKGWCVPGSGICYANECRKNRKG